MNENLLKESREILAKNPFAAATGMEILEIGTGYMRARAKKKRELENIYGDMHGGSLYTITDTMAGIAASTYGYYVTTVNGSIQYLKAARNTEYIYCEAEVIKPGRTITVVHVNVRDDNGALLNTAEFTFFNLKKRQEGETV